MARPSSPRVSTDTGECTGADAAADDDGRETGGGAGVRSSRRLGGEDGEGERKESFPRTASKSLMLRELPMSDVEAQRARERADMSRPSGVRLCGESVRARATSSRPRTLSSKSVWLALKCELLACTVTAADLPKGCPAKQWLRAPAEDSKKAPSGS